MKNSLRRVSVGILSLALFVPFFAFGATQPANTLPDVGQNPVPVTACTNINGGIHITRPEGASYPLLNGVKDAGHGIKHYTYWCTSPTIYNVAWKPAPTTPTPTPPQCSDFTITTNGTWSVCVNNVATLSQSGITLSPILVHAKTLRVSFKGANIQKTSIPLNKTKWINAKNNASTKVGIRYLGPDASGRAIIHVTTLIPQQPQPDTHAPTAWINVMSKQDVDNGYKYTLSLGSYDTSPMQKMILSGGLASEFPSLPHVKTWEYTSNAHAVQENITIPFTLEYGKTYRFQLAGWDNVGNASTIAVLTIDVPAKTTDTQNPTITTEMSSKVIQSGNSYTVVPVFSAKAMDNSSELQQVVIYYSTSSDAITFSIAKTCNPATPNTWCTYEGTQTQDDGYFYAKAWDKAGNMTTSETATLSGQI